MGLESSVIGDYLFVALYFPVAMTLAIAGMVWRAVRGVFGGAR